MGKELARLKDRNERDFCLGPTHEEVITDIVRSFVQSYKQLPLHLYKIQTKFRDETRPRFGLMRGREFLMKDGYSFHEASEDALKEYQNMFQTYHRIFKRCGLEFRAVEAETGDIGGSLSHEFHVLAQSGEDEVLSCDQCQYTANSNLIQKKPNEDCLKCHKGKFKSYRGIEVGHIFYLGDKYSKALNATFLNKEGEKKYFEMGCYGIGVGRTAAAAIEQNHDENGILWPISIAPFEVAVIPIQGSDAQVVQHAEQIEKELESKGVEVLYYDKDDSAGVKFKDVDLLGIPLRVTVGSKGLAQQSIGIKLRQEKEEKCVPLAQVLPELMKVRDELFKKTNPSS
ncbi:MAG: proline--tRNA ligase [Deltaproteobacteria bacterium]|nr:proline--tRNA ligase [Deltaproteobacteria bacterium]